jgi:hypothetical protein
MNCHDISLLLDTRDIRRLTTTERQSVETHLQDCAECAHDWRTQQRVLGGQVPAMASDLPARIWSSLEPSASTKLTRLRARGTLLLGSLLLIGAAAAMFGWLLLRDVEPEPASIAMPAAIQIDDGKAAATAPEVSVSNVEPSLPESTSNQVLQDPATPRNPPRHKVIVLPPTYENPDAAAMEYFNASYGAFLGELRSKADLQIVEVTAQELEAAEADLPPSPLAGPNSQPSALAANPFREEDMPLLLAQLEKRENAIRHHFNGEYTLRIKFVAYPGRPNTREIVASYFGPSGSASMSSITGPQLPGNSGSSSSGSPTSRARDIGISKAREVYARLLPDSGSSQYLSVLKNPLESESMRLNALNAYLQGKATSAEKTSPELTDDIAEVAVELSQSSNPQSRRQIWTLLGRTATPAALRALAHGLRTEPDTQARRNIALSLFDHASDPDVRAEFELAATADTSAEVRLIAKVALLPDSGRLSYITATLKDRSLTHQARMEPLTVLRRGNLKFLSNLVLDEQSLSEIRQIAEESSNAFVKGAANSELARAAGSIRQAP